MSNRFATLSRSKAAKAKNTPAKKKRPRRKLDDYETPPEATAALVPFVALSGNLLEPCAGSGRMVRELKRLFPSLKIESADIKRGRDFMKRTAPFKGHCFTNPPYGGGKAEAFARQALKLCSGKAACSRRSHARSRPKRSVPKETSIQSALRHASTSGAYGPVYSRTR